ncbi:MAG: ethylbenzene dehydrogenase-related protein [bacterium]
MRTGIITVYLSAAFLLIAAGMTAPAMAQGGKPPENEKTVAEGKVIYFDRCVYCHGVEGAGDGPAADFLDPRPRDFTVGMFKLRTTLSGELPTDNDLFKAVSKGLSGTAMPRWELTLSEAERWKVIFFIKTFSPEFADEEYDPEKKVVPAANRVPFSEESVAKGREVFKKAKCWECHGRQGRGDGQKSDTLEDGWGFKVRVRNLTRGWNLKGGTRPEDIFFRFSTGINGTPMPSFRSTLSEEQRWHLANYISSIAATKESEEVVLAAVFRTGKLPESPEDPAWQSAKVLRVPLTGQVLAKPRWQNISVDLVEVRAIYNEQDIALLVVWDDPFQDGRHDPEQEVKTFETTYVKAFGKIPRKLGTFRDAVAVQFPARLRSGVRKPHFFRGDASNPVNLWVWQSDRQLNGGNPIQEFDARGFKKPMRPRPAASQQVRGNGSWKNGQWRVVMTRPLATENKRGDIQFKPGRLIPIAFNVWDGSNGEHGLIMSLSAWSFLALEAPVPLSLFWLTALVVLGVVLGEWWFVRFSGRKNRESA